MVIVEIYLNDQDMLTKAEFPAMIRVGEYISIFDEDLFTYYCVKKIWYRMENDNKKCTPCAEVVIDD